jgi:hypothetical protein
MPTPPADVPELVATIAVGNLAVLKIDHVFPRATCLIQADLEVFALRWTRKHWISLHTVGDVMVADAKALKRSDSILSNDSMRRPSVISAIVGGSKAAALHITYSDSGGVVRVLELIMQEEKAIKWSLALKSLREMVPQSASQERWRWVLSCMASAAHGGAEGLLSKAGIGSLLRCAHATIRSSAALEQISGSFEKFESPEIPRWLRRSDPSVRLSGFHVFGLLFHLSTSSKHITALFEQYRGQKKLWGMEEWLSFIRNEQLAAQSEPAAEALRAESHATELGLAEQRFELRARQRDEFEAGFDAMQLTSELLARQNNAVAPERASLEVNEPLAHFWSACSHK